MRTICLIVSEAPHSGHRRSICIPLTKTPSLSPGRFHLNGDLRTWPTIRSVHGSSTDGLPTRWPSRGFPSGSYACEQTLSAYLLLWPGKRKPVSQILTHSDPPFPTATSSLLSPELTR